MRKRPVLHVVGHFLLMLFSWGSVVWNVKAENPSRPLLLVHYMPWYAAPPVSPRWGWHWTMNRFNPHETDANGRRRIASHQYPLIEPYDSGDPDVLECQALLMKYAGIDGVIVDWYGIENINDYALLNRNTGLFFVWARRAGLRFAICYEDRTLRPTAEAAPSGEGSVIARGQSALRHLQAQWFDDPLYLRQEGRPVLLIFGPESLSDQQWNAVLSALPKRPLVATLHERRTFAAGAFAWPPMWASENGVLSPERLRAYWETFASKSKTWELRIAAAFPGFHDVYEQAGIHPSYGYLDDRHGTTFRETLHAARHSGADFVQLVTWNDYGEGTAIEPTAERGYRDLEAIQEARRNEHDGFPYQADDLRLPVRLFRLRKRFAGNAEATASLNRIASALFEGNPAQARQQLADFPTE